MALTLVMYHYVRDLERSRWPRIKGLTTERFRGQLDYIARHHTVVGTGEVVAALRGGAPLPPNACLLTFDDGFVDHYDVVLPVLLERGLTASFYPPAEAIEEGRVLDVHKIHFILASMDDATPIVEEILRGVAALRREHDLPADETLVDAYMKPSRLDPAEVIFVKRALQHGLPQPARSTIVDALFERFVSRDEAAFAGGLYMSIDTLRELSARGMDIGGHGYRHDWLAHLDEAEQRFEIDQTRRFLRRVSGTEPQDWVMCYPYGSYDGITLELLRARGCALGLTTRVDLCRDLSQPLELPRLDTNDLPTRGDAARSGWSDPVPARPT